MNIRHTEIFKKGQILPKRLGYFPDIPNRIRHFVKFGTDVIYYFCKDINDYVFSPLYPWKEGESLLEVKGLVGIKHRNKTFQNIQLKLTEGKRLYYTRVGKTRILDIRFVMGLKVDMGLLFHDPFKYKGHVIAIGER